MRRNVKDIYRTLGHRLGPERHPYETPTRVPPVPLGLGKSSFSRGIFYAGELEFPRRNLHPKPPSDKKFPYSRGSKVGTYGDRFLVVEFLLDLAL
ncbi:hypothetical protein RHMOL_Rhmol10G0181100 [Rhododendron molle]|uniref:Uncharacterized protein n=1 Tax=Rhododendron molle TaxID=49168 RepID=A0ACC0M5B4_RHOML|nr:hypothetical protein RHMOL_Rhmol10G0181100 [Rhododendron molle]